MRRGDVYWSEQPPPVGRRPVLLLSRDGAYEYRSLAITAYVTTRRRGIRAEVPLTAREDGMPRDSVANLDSLNTIGLATLRDYITTLSPERMREVDETLHYALGLRD